MLRVCACCAFASAESTCARCGEGSWILVDAPQPELQLASVKAEPQPIQAPAAPQHNNGSRRHRR